MSDNEDKDLTRIEDLAEFLHDENDDGLFDEEEEEASDEQAPALPSLDDLDPNDEEEPPAFESAPDEVDEALEEASFGGDEFESSSDDSNEVDFGDTNFGDDTQEDDPFSGGDEFGDGEFESNEEEVSFGEMTEPEENSEDEEIEPEPITLEEAEEEDPIVDDFTPPPVSEYEPTPEQETPKAPPQNFEDLRQFAENISYGAVSQGGNPPFSLVLRGIKYQEDANDIMIILREHGLVSDDNEQQLEQGLANGSLLISQISEYSAIYLAHRFRRFDLDVMVGLSDEIYPTHSYDADARGLVSKQSIRQNTHESFDLDRAPVKISNIILSTTPTLESYTIREYLGVISHHSVLSSLEIEEFSPGLTQTGDEVVDAIQRDLKEVLEMHGTGDEEDIKPFGQGLEALYKEMADALRSQALKIGANAIVGINYQLTPVIHHEGREADVKYKVTCLGSAVWVVGD